MDYQNLIDKLANHANLYDGSQFLTHESLVFNLWNTTRTGSKFDIVSIGQDVLRCLEELNIYFNGSPPSSVRATDKKDIDGELVRIVCSLINTCLEYSLVWEGKQLFDSAYRDKLKETTWMLSHAWCALLDGDIDSLQHGFNDHRIALDI